MSLERAWRLRFEQKNHEAETILEKLEAEPPSADPETRWQTQLLRVSLLRANGASQEAERLLEKIGAEIFSVRSVAPFQFYFQKAIQIFIVDDFSTSLEFFLRADSVATRPAERLISLMNVLTCLENLNLPWENTLRELEKLLAAIDRDPADSDISFVTAARKQLTAFKVRSHFRAARFGDAFSLSLTEGMDQSHYYLLWIGSLPYVDFAKSRRLELLERLTRTRGIYAKGYRLETVMADLRMSENQNADSGVQTAQQVDRLYLWTWNWLASPTESARELLRGCLSSFDFHGAVRKMTFEDFQMLRNALSWIALFQKHLAPWIRQYLSLFSVEGDAAFPIFDYERLWIEAWGARRAGQSSAALEARIRKHPAHRCPELRMESLVRGWFPPKASGRSLRPATKNTIVVDDESHRIFAGGKTIHSEAIVKTLLALAESEAVSFSDLLWLGYGLSEYDEEVHAPKIYNCLARIKELLPKSVRIKTKSGVAYWEGPKTVVQRLKQDPREKSVVSSHSELKLRGRIRPGATVHFERPVHPRTLLSQAAGKTVLRREEIQKLMRSSKATTVRWLEKWVDQGLIRKEGVGRAIRYHLESSSHYRLTGPG